MKKTNKEFKEKVTFSHTKAYGDHKRKDEANKRSNRDSKRTRPSSGHDAVPRFAAAFARVFLTRRLKTPKTVALLFVLCHKNNLRKPIICICRLVHRRSINK